VVGHQPRVAGEVTDLEGGRRVVRKVAKAVERPLYAGVACELPGKHVRGRALPAGEEQEEVVAEGVPDVLAQVELARLDRVVREERVRPHPAERGGVLVLLADGAAQELDLEVTGRGGELGGLEVFAGEQAERLDRAHGVGAGGAEPRARRRVGDRGQLHGATVPVLGERLAQDGMSDVGGVVHLLPFEVLEAVAPLEPGGGDDVHVAVDRRRHDEPAVLAVVRGQIRSAPAKGHSQRRPRDDRSHAGRNLCCRRAQAPPRARL
jgi:hypothetical protein